MDFNIKSHLPKGVADALFEEDAPTESNKSLPRPAQIVAVPVQEAVPTNYTYTPATTTPINNPLLADLRTRTSFEDTPIGKQLQGFLNDLADQGLPETQKQKLALKLSHIPASSVIDTLNGLVAVLAADKDKFDAQMATATQNEVNGRQQKMAQIDSQINDMESQLNALRTQKSSLAGEIDSKSRQIQTLKDNYKSAFDVRSGEISTQISHYQSILQG